jgi:hypothetical protein
MDVSMLTVRAVSKSGNVRLTERKQITPRSRIPGAPLKVVFAATAATSVCTI